MRDGWQALVPDRISGKEVSVGTFPTPELAEQARATAMRDIERGHFDDPGAGRMKFGVYSADWMAERPMADSTREERQRLLDNYILPTFRHRAMDEITGPRVRKWFAAQRALKPEGTRGEHQPAKAYKLMREICATAVVDGIYRQGNPVNIPKAGVQLHQERDITVASWPAIIAIADTVRPWHRALVIAAACQGGRLSEWARIERCDVNLLDHRITLDKAFDRHRTKTKKPKNPTAAGRATMPLLDLAHDALTIHMDKYVGPEPDALVFAGPNGGPLRGSNWNAEWTAACEAVGITGLRFHDLRHVAGTMFASTPGATVKNVKRFLRQSTTRAAQLYIHATTTQQDALVAAMNERVNIAVNEQSNVRAIR